LQPSEEQYLSLKGQRTLAKQKKKSYGGMVKVLFEVETDGEFPPVSSESVWAKPLGEELYRLENIPFYAGEATLGDVVKARTEEGELWFDEMVEESDNSLIWVIVMDGDPEELITAITDLGCDVERCNSEYFAINIPPTVKLSKVTRFLAKNEKLGLLGYSEPILRQ
jgi:hypothetical protein